MALRSQCSAAQENNFTIYHTETMRKTQLNMPVEKQLQINLSNFLTQVNFSCLSFHSSNKQRLKREDWDELVASMIVAFCEFASLKHRFFLLFAACFCI